MKLLLDECVVQEFRLLIDGHDVFTVGYLGWSGVKNGQLLSRAAANGFDALITTDRNIEKQQNLSSLPIALIILIAASNDLDDLTPLIPDLLRSLNSLKPRTVIRVGQA
ncbi:MAG TPA: DUF5615 family PIN-like protein [Tepidisphaeraceae bacterium]|jgi:hypothetical protein|nr:DUF5615 family PIN-like protein [Tepidisphaeraceae bacterium]